jgi:hypothetical protein
VVCRAALILGPTVLYLHVYTSCLENGICVVVTLLQNVDQ